MDYILTKMLKLPKKKYIKSLLKDIGDREESLFYPSAVYMKLRLFSVIHLVYGSPFLSRP